VPEPRAVDAPTSDRLRAILLGSANAMPSPAAITSIERRPSPYRSSYPLEELTVTFADGVRLELMCKGLNRGSLTPVARAAKPAGVYDPHREIAVYRSILSGASTGTARYYAAAENEEDGYWLLIATC
jgi:hypothetical protein